MSAYMLVEILVKDEKMYAEYMEQIPSVIAKYNGQYLVRSSKVTPNTGGWMPDRIILVKFDSLKELRTCFGSSEYTALAPMREKATQTRSVVIEDK